MSNTIYSDKIKVSCPLVHDENGYYHLIYKIVNTINRKIYIGKHTTKDPYDDYFGSGKIILKALVKYGIEYFTKEILYCFTDEKEAFLQEKEIVTLEFVDRDDTYNIITGGRGFSSEDMSGEKNPMRNKETREKLSKANLGEKNPMYGKRGKNNPNFGKSPSQETRNKISKANKGKHVGEKNPMYGRQHTQETRDKISNTLKGKMTGEKNPMYGRQHTQETRDKISNTLKGKMTGEKNPMYGRRGEKCPVFGTNNPNAKAIIKLDEFGNIVTEYGTVKDCCEQEQISRKLFYKLIKNHILHNGFYFAYS